MKKGTGKAVRFSMVATTGVLLASVAHAQTDNTATGVNALISISDGDNNTAMGTFALRNTTIGSNNTAMGRAAMRMNTSGASNTAIGTNALYTNTNGVNNTSVGHESLTSNTSGAGNTAVGMVALYANTNGQFNTAVGYAALSSNTLGESNTAVGFLALNANSTGVNNVALGRSALSENSIGQNNTAVGHGSGPSTYHLTNTGAFGFDARTTANNTIRIGNSFIVSIGGVVGWSNLSDARFKTGVRENVPGLAFITKLRPVTFHWDLKKLDAFNGKDAESQDETMTAAQAAKEEKAHTGFLAQEVESAASQCGFDFSGVVKPANEESQYQLSYAEFVVPLVKAVQEQQKEIEELRLALQRTASHGQATGSAQHASAMGSFFGSALGIAGTLLALLYLKRSRGLAAAS